MKIVAYPCLRPGGFEIEIEMRRGFLGCVCNGRVEIQSNNKFKIFRTFKPKSPFLRGSLIDIYLPSQKKRDERKGTSARRNSAFKHPKTAMRGSKDSIPGSCQLMSSSRPRIPYRTNHILIEERVLSHSGIRSRSDIMCSGKDL